MEQTNTKVLISYFLSLLALAIPFWMLGSLTHIHGLPFDMQLSVLIVLVIPLVTIYFVRRVYGAQSLKQMFMECLPKRRGHGIGLAVAFLTMPLAAVVVSLATRLFATFDGWSVSLYLLPIYFIVYYLAAAIEETGWTWFATPILSKKLSLLSTGLVIGVVWSVIHMWPWLQQNGFWFMVGMTLLSILNRIVIVWLYLKNGRLLWLCIAYHAMINTTFTVFHHGSLYANPLAYAPAVLLLVLVITAKRPRISAR